MSNGIFPTNTSATNPSGATNAYTPNNSSCSPTYYPDCPTTLDVGSLNAIISEILQVCDQYPDPVTGIGYDCSKTDNLYQALLRAMTT